MRTEISKAREAAWYVVSRCRRYDLWSQQMLDNARARFSLDERDAALCARLCLSVLQNAALCDYYIDCYSSVSSARMEPQTRDILRLGICQLLFTDRIPVSAAISQSVELAKAHARRSAGLVNAVLRRVAENKNNLPTVPQPGTAFELSIRYSHPLWLCEKLVKEHGYTFAKAFFAADNRQPGLTLSVNLCRTDAVFFAETLIKNGRKASLNRLSEISVDLQDGGAVASIPGYEEGAFFVQDAAAASSILRTRPAPGSRILDACAAPGGKSMLCASLMRDEGEILACDVSEKKLPRIMENANRLGFSSVRTRQMDASDPHKDLLEQFDLVICDVPCSGFGVVRKKPEIRYKTPEEIRRLPEIQEKILRGAAGCVRPGGTLLYSTCTIFKEENEEVVSAFLSDNSAFSVEEMRTVWPQEYDTDGFFFCRMRKNDNSK